jgi:prolyl oligopeptidase PreP (S9A serine peptidase family)
VNKTLKLLGLEKQRQVKKSISKLLDENNKVIKEQGEILNTIKDYYEKLYTSKKTDEISSKEYIFDTKLDKIKLSSVISKESRCDDKSCSSFSKDLLASRLNFDLLLQYIIVASLISIFRTSHKSRQ